jgi:iodotyrosine deiodinase
MTNHPHIPYTPEHLDEAEMLRRAGEFEALMESRRSVRFFRDDPVPRSLVEAAVRTASTAPSGAHRQPWTFVLVSDPSIKKEIRIAAEAEERRSYEGGRMPDEWKKALEPLGTDWRKPYLETAPWIAVLFAQQHGWNPDGSRRKHYYVSESCGIAAGLFIAALHNMGLATLTHTPSPMAFLRETLSRPKEEKPFILFPIGHPAMDCTVPDLARKELSEVSVFL